LRLSAERRSVWSEKEVLRLLPIPIEKFIDSSTKRVHRDCEGPLSTSGWQTRNDALTLSASSA
jgi:hypothetical protein